MSDGPALEARNLVKHFPTRRSAFGRRGLLVRAVDGVDLTVPRGQTFGLVGESGCGKTTFAMLVLKLLEPTSGQILFEGRDVGAMRRRAVTDFRRAIQIVFQDPYGALDPRQTVRSALMEPLVTLRAAPDRPRARERVAHALHLVGLDAEVLGRLPHELSGGQRQRVVIARALVVRPRFVVLDEPTASLDVSVQAQILSLLEDLKGREGLTYLLISHNLVVTRCMSDVVAVMYLGQIVEIAGSTELFSGPLHPYSAALISAIPVPDPETRPMAALARGDVPSPVSMPSGCRYHPRCPYAEKICAEEVPPLRRLHGDHHAACHFPGVAGGIAARNGSGVRAGPGPDAR